MPLALVPAGALAPGERPQARPAQSQPATSTLAATGSARPAPLRGTGYLILDPRDAPDEVRARLSKFVLEVRLHSDILPGELRRQVDAFLGSDFGGPEPLPNLPLLFPPGTSRDQVLSYLRNTRSARESELFCPRACPIEALFSDGFHIHLTRPTGSAGDSLFALEFTGGGASGAQTQELGAVVEGASKRKQSLLERYPTQTAGRKPVGKVFGVPIYLGEALTPESSQLPHE